MRTDASRVWKEGSKERNIIEKAEGLGSLSHDFRLIFYIVTLTGAHSIVGSNDEEGAFVKDERPPSIYTTSSSP